MKTEGFCRMLESRRNDLLVVLVILVSSLLIFGLGSSRLGFYADDASFLSGAPDLNWSNLAQTMLGYVTGRNLHMLWQFGVYQIFGYQISDLVLHHWLQAFITGVNASLLYIAIRVFSYKPFESYLAASIFAFYPNHAEVQYWLSSLPMNLMSTFFVLIQIILGVLCMKEMDHKGAKFVYRILIFSFIAYFCALFTYDQAVPVAFALSTFTAILIISRKQFRFAGLTYLLATFGLFAALLIWKINVPGGGPIFNNVKISHIWNTFNLSLSIMFGGIFQSTVQNLLPLASLQQKMVAFAIVVPMSGLALGLLLGWHKNFDEKYGVNGKKIFPFLPFKTILIQSSKLFFAVAFFVTAYIPLYIWYIAPRHNYLPSIGLAFGIAFLIHSTLSISRFLFGKWATFLIGISLVLLSANYLYRFIKVDLIEKQAWTVSYQARKNLYTELEKLGLLKSGMSLIIGNLPTTTPYGSAPFGYQPADDVGLITEGRIQIKLLDRNIQPSESGVYVLTSANDYGPDGFRHIPWNKALVLSYKKLDGEKIIFDVLGPKYFSTRTLFHNVVPLESSREIKFSGVHEKNVLKIQIPEISLQKGDVLTLLPLVETGKNAVPMAILNSANIPLSFLIEVPPSLVGKKFELLLPPGMARVSDLQLFIGKNEERSMLLYETHILEDAAFSKVDSAAINK